MNEELRSAEYLSAEVHLTDAAAAKTAELLAEEGDEHLKLRVFISGGGCAGFQYGFRFDDAVRPGDAIAERDGVTLLIDAVSYMYLIGAEIDYVEDLRRAQFVIRNPNAVSTCSCGSSFSA